MRARKAQVGGLIKYRENTKDISYSRDATRNSSVFYSKDEIKMIFTSYHYLNSPDRNVANWINGVWTEAFNYNTGFPRLKDRYEFEDKLKTFIVFYQNRAAIK